jgi:CheY-like chemotaxis protein
VERDLTLERPRIGVVVGEGHPMRRGLLRFVLEGEGFTVLADVSTAVELVQALAVHRPDAVVLDDGVGPTAVVLTREMRPDAKIVLVWPPDLVPIRGDATVDPTQVLRELGPAVERACGVPTIEPVTATVRTMTDRAARPSRPFRHVHPSAGMADVLPGPGVARVRPQDDEPIIVDREPAPILILPVSPVVERDPQP